MSIQISGAYLSAGRGFLSVRLSFTDGSVADGYIDDTSGVVMLYSDFWNGFEGYEGKTFHTLRLFNRSAPANILVSRAFDEDDPVLLNIDADGDLQFRAAIEPIGEGLAYIPIDTAGELALIGRDTTTLTGNYLLMRNLDLLGPSASSGLVQFPHNWQPIKGANAQSEADDRFSGIFDGNSKAITNLYAYYPGNNGIGLFGYLDGAEIRNLTVSGSVTGVNDCGGIAGAARDSVIINCSFSGAVRGTNSAGGIAGYIEGSTITGASNTGGTVTITELHAGGVVGFCEGEVSAITGCSNVSAVSGYKNIGGILGCSSYGITNITDCYNTGTVSAGRSDVGGIAGTLNSSPTNITNCYNTGTVSAVNAWSGGIVGDIPWYAQGSAIIACYNIGYISGGGNYVGGVAGRSLTITACYNTGTVSGNGNWTGGVAGYATTISASYNTGTVLGTGNNIGGVAGQGHEANIAACYNTGQVSGNINVGGVVGLLSSGVVTACYWQAGTADAGIASGTDAGGITPFDHAGEFPEVTTTTHEAWGTGNGEENGWWKENTTGGGMLPRLWFQTE